MPIAKLGMRAQQLAVLLNTLSVTPLFKEANGQKKTPVYVLGIRR
jgi:hypothetical protein